MPTDEEASEIARRATPWLLSLPGVNLVGLGAKEVNGVPTGELAIRVYVNQKVPTEQLPPDQVIPAEIEGVTTDVIVGGDLIYTAGPSGWCRDILDEGEGKTYRPLVPGVRIMPKNSTFAGSIGCFMQHKTEKDKFFLLTNNHVCGPPDLGPAKLGETRVGQPTGEDSCTKCCSDMVGTFAGGSGGPGDLNRDEALVRLDQGMKFLAKIPDIGFITGVAPPLTVAQAKAGTFQVRKRGSRTRLTGGVVVDLQATGAFPDNIIVVKPNPPASSCPTQNVFLDIGDSGSALVDNASVGTCKIVGLLFALDSAGNGFAYAIGKVLKRLEIEESLPVDIVTASKDSDIVTVPGAAMVPVPPELVPDLLPEMPEPVPVPGAPGLAGDRRTPARMPAPTPPRPALVPAGVSWSTAEPPTLATLHALQADLERSEPGRLLVRLWLRHQRELSDLVNHNRRVTAAWYRSGGSALFQLFTRMAGRPETTIPHTVNGVPLAECVERIEEIFTRFGSALLRTDMARVRSVLPELGSLAGLTYPQLITALHTS